MGLTVVAVGSLITTIFLTSTAYRGFRVNRNCTPAQPDDTATTHAGDVHANLPTQSVSSRTAQLAGLAAAALTDKNEAAIAVANSVVLPSAAAVGNQVTMNASESEGYLAFCVLARNEGPYFSEWLQYHKLRCRRLEVLCI